MCAITVMYFVRGGTMLGLEQFLFQHFFVKQPSILLVPQYTQVKVVTGKYFFEKLAILA